MRRHQIRNLNESDISVVTGGSSTENRKDYLKRTSPDFPISKLHYPRFSPAGGLPKIRYYKTSAERKNIPSECPLVQQKLIYREDFFKYNNSTL